MTPDVAINLVANLGGIGLMLVIVFVGIAELRSVRSELNEQNRWLREVVDRLTAMARQNGNRGN